jgi:hypothetical protein
MGGRIDKGKKTYFTGPPVCRVSIASQRIRIKKHFVKINSDLVRKLPAAGWFYPTMRNAWSRCQEENSRGNFESDRIFASRAEGGQRWKPAIQVLKFSL